MSRLHLALDRLGLLEEAVAIAQCWGVSLSAVEGPGRYREAVGARHRVMALLHERGALSASAVGRLVNRDHSTVLAALKKDRAPTINARLDRWVLRLDRAREELRAI